jgi:peptidoglycan/xylan/chitin deacetylase (PgdA/CDA1 family)
MQDPNQILLHCRQRLNFPPVEFLNWNQVNELQKKGHEIGSHTMWHAKLSDLGITEIQEDLVSSKEILEQKCGPIEHFAYPYGRWFHFSKEALDATWAAGYTTCASAERGCHLPTEGIDKRELVIRRDHILANWPISHVDYFMENNVRQFNPTLNPWK